MHVTRTGVLLRPNNARVLYRPFEPTNPQRATRIIGRVMALGDHEVDALLAAVLSEFHGRHQRLVNFFQERFESVDALVARMAVDVEEARRLLGST